MLTSKKEVKANDTIHTSELRVRWEKLRAKHFVYCRRIQHQTRKLIHDMCRSQTYEIQVEFLEMKKSLNIIVIDNK